MIIYIAFVQYICHNIDMNDRSKRSPKPQETLQDYPLFFEELPLLKEVPAPLINSKSPVKKDRKRVS